MIDSVVPNALSITDGNETEREMAMNVNDLSSRLSRPSTTATDNLNSLGRLEKSPSSATAYQDFESTLTLSALSRQLEASARWQAERDIGLSPNELKALGRRLLSDFMWAQGGRSKAAMDAERPDTDDPDLLSRAQQATDSLYGRAPNPFQDLKQAQLLTIAYDDSGTFTSNERHAAYNRASELHYEWSRQFLMQMDAELKRTQSTLDESWQALIDYYDGLPAVHTAAFGNYRVEYALKMGQDYGEHLGKKPDALTTLVDRLSSNWNRTPNPLKDWAEPSSPASPDP